MSEATTQPVSGPISESGPGGTHGGRSGPVAADSPTTKPSASKDRNCPYCNQAFTSSSLGRHLDLYIKEKNPKPPDGLHDVGAIRKMRGTITRRQPRGSLASRRDSSNPATPTAVSRRSPASDASSANTSAHLTIGPHNTLPGSSKPSTTGSVIPKDGQYAVDQSGTNPSAVVSGPGQRYPFQPTWEATGVINDIPSNDSAEGLGPGKLERSDAQHAAASRDNSCKQVSQRAPSRMTQKAQLDSRQKLADAMDTARAAELALREILSSLRAAKCVTPVIMMAQSPVGFPANPAIQTTHWHRLDAV